MNLIIHLGISVANVVFPTYSEPKISRCIAFGFLSQACLKYGLLDAIKCVNRIKELALKG